jgi:hypothetical protein
MKSHFESAVSDVGLKKSPFPSEWKGNIVFIRKKKKMRLWEKTVVAFRNREVKIIRRKKKQNEFVNHTIKLLINIMTNKTY